MQLLYFLIISYSYIIWVAWLIFMFKPIFMMFDRYMFQRNWGLVVHFLKNIFDDKILVNLMIFAWSMIYYREKKLSPFCPCHSILRIDPDVFFVKFSVLPLHCLVFYLFCHGKFQLLFLCCSFIGCCHWFQDVKNNSTVCNP